MQGNTQISDESQRQKYKRLCTVDGCGKKHFGHGLCHMHHWRVTHHGDINGGRTSPGELLKYTHDVVMTHQTNDCLAWPYARNKSGYGQLWHKSKRLLASRYVCELVNGPAPTDKHEAAHICGNGHLGCVSPRHLVWKTAEENRADKAVHKVIRGAAAVALLGTSAAPPALEREG